MSSIRRPRRPRRQGTIHGKTTPIRSVSPGRRLRGAVRDSGQTALVLVIAITILLATVGAVMVSTIANNDPLVTQASIQRYAYRALASGLSAYQQAINTDPYLAACNSSTNGNAQCAGLNYGTWSEVPDTDLGNGVIPEYYKFDNPQAVIDPTTYVLSSLQVQIVGAAGFSGKDVYYSTIAKFVPANGFLNNVWWTNFESAGVPSSCQYWWATGYSNSGGCTPVYFISADTLNGPVFSNDSIFVDGKPNFGTTSPYWSATTADPSCQFVDPEDGSNGSPPSATPPGTCANAATSDMGNYNAALSSHSAKNIETIPPDNLKLGSYAQANGCYYVGPTTITLTGSTMKVLSPESATDANLDLSTDTSTCPTNGTTSAPLPANGVIYVDQNPASNPTIAGVNPFDGYQAACGGGRGTCTYDTQTQATCPGCYEGQTSSPDTEGDVFVQGSLSGHLTVSANNDVVIDGPIKYADCLSWKGTAHESLCNYNSATGATPNDVLGLIAYNFVEISRPVDSNGNVLASCNNAVPVLTDPLTASTAPLCDPATSSGSPKSGGSAGLTVDGSILALQQSFAVNNHGASGVEGSLTIYGSIQQNSRGAVGTFSGGAIATGYGKDYNYDPRLALYSPPYYLTPGTPSWNLDSSAESYQGSEPQCPPAQSTPSTTALTWPIAGSIAVGSGICTAAS